MDSHFQAHLNNSNTSNYPNMYPNQTHQFNNEISNFNSNHQIKPANTTPKLQNLLNSNTISTSNSLPLSSNTFSSSPSPIQNNLSAVTSNTSSVKLENDIAPKQQQQQSQQQAQLPKKKPRRKSSVNEEKILLSTSSPEGIAAASEITPHRIAGILTKQGPLPIRHLTGHLVNQVPAFGNLSLSKQRRLIMAALESGDLITGCIFEKIGWGQWEAKVVGKDIVKLKIQNSLNNQNAASQNEPIENDLNNQFNNSQSPISLPDQKIKQNNSRTSNANSILNRRESITNHLNDSAIKVPTSPTLGPIQNFRKTLENYGDIDEAIESSSSSNDYDDEDDDDVDDDMQNRFKLNASPNSPTNVDYSNGTNSTKISINKVSNMRSPSTSSSRRPSFAGIVKPRKPRTSFNQHTLEVALDEAPLERREARVSFSNSSNLSRQSFLRTNILPRPSNNNSNISLSFNDKDNENAITDDYDENENLNKSRVTPDTDGTNHTDEEDWQAIGPSSLKKNRQLSISNSSNSNLFNNPNHQTPEEMAAFALMDLKTT